MVNITTTGTLDLRRTWIFEHLRPQRKKETGPQGIEGCRGMTEGDGGGDGAKLMDVDIHVNRLPWEAF
jgi:hypothetical protein